MVKTELIVEKKSFDNAKGEKVEYNSCTAKIGGVEVNFMPKPEDKKLFNYLMGNLDGGDKKGVK